MTLLSDHERSQSTVTITAAQWAELKELLRPGYEVAKMYLADMQRRQDTPPEEAQTETAPADESTS